MAITFFSGSMFGQKSKMLIDYIRAAQRDKVPHIIYKPTVDERDGLFVKSRVYDEKIPARPWNGTVVSKLNILKHLKAGVKEVFIDEVHFLSYGDIFFIVNMCDRYNANLYASGLLTDFRNDDFPGSRWLWENCDSKRFFHGNCNKCKDDWAVWNVLVDKDGNRVTSGESIQVGDSDKYIVLCHNCF